MFVGFYAAGDILTLVGFGFVWRGGGPMTIISNDEVVDAMVVDVPKQRDAKCSWVPVGVSECKSLYSLAGWQDYIETLIKFQ